jgi:Trehalose utilisation
MGGAPWDRRPPLLGRFEYDLVLATQRRQVPARIVRVLGDERPAEVVSRRVMPARQGGLDSPGAAERGRQRVAVLVVAQDVGHLHARALHRLVVRDLHLELDRVPEREGIIVLGGSPGCIGNRPGDPNVVNNTGSCFQAVVETEDDKHPSTRHLPDRWNISDELYNFKANPRSTVHVLQTLDESSYNFQPHPFIRNWGALMGEDHPITWCQKYDGGRVWYTGLGHDANIYANHDSMAMIVQGMKWAAGKWGLRGYDEEG